MADDLAPLEVLPPDPPEEEGGIVPGHGLVGILVEALDARDDRGPCRSVSDDPDGLANAEHPPAPPLR
jgi:hypothetical protein